MAALLYASPLKEPGPVAMAVEGPPKPLDRSVPRHPPLTPNPSRSPGSFPSRIHDLRRGNRSSSTQVTTETNLASPDLPPSPLPTVPPQVHSLRAGFKRRRSSYPPSSNPSSSIEFTLGGTPRLPSSKFEGKPSWSLGMPTEGFGRPLTPNDPSSWSRLLNLDPSPAVVSPNWRRPSIPIPPSLGEAAPGANRRASVSVDDPLGLGSDVPSFSGMDTSHVQLTPEKIAQLGSDLVWKTMLGSVVDVEGMGEVQAAKLLLEVWKRGGSEAVTTQCLWSSVVMALCLSSSIPGVRAATPSPRTVSAAQKVYELSIRPWESTIFAGLLTSYLSTPISVLPAVTPHYGPSTPTPTKELDLSLWTNMSPAHGDASAFLAGPSNAASTSRTSFPFPSSLAPYELHAESDRRHSLGVESVAGLDALLAEMEESQVAMDRAATQAQVETPSSSELFGSRPSTGKRPLPRSRLSSFYQLPTPETTNTDSPSLPKDRQASSAPASRQLSPELQVTSPFFTASTDSTSAVSHSIPIEKASVKSLEAVVGARANHPTSLTLPSPNFVPPPPMCMFFSPQFRDLDKGKVGVWKGDLVVKGRGGGTFSILIVGEEGSGHLWQSHLWPSKISYPPNPPSETEKGPPSCTSTMTPVAHLARQGLTPVTMGMVLCNDSNIEGYVSMVQGLHAEGVAFHLTNPGQLPIVFLPAKFDSADPLQRLGVAFMLKPGTQRSSASKKEQASANSASGELKKKRRRRQSAPAQSITKPHRRKGSLASVAIAGRRRAQGADIVEEEVIED